MAIVRISDELSAREHVSLLGLEQRVPVITGRQLRHDIQCEDLKMIVVKSVHSGRSSEKTIGGSGCAPGNGGARAG